MDFLLSFNLYEGLKKLKFSNGDNNTDTYLNKTGLVYFALLSVNVPLWEYLQIQGIFWRYIITTFWITFIDIHQEKDLTSLVVIIIIDFFYLIDVISAIVYRKMWPKESKEPKESSSHLAKLVWKNGLFRPRRIWMIILDLISLFPNYFSPKMGYRYLIYFANFCPALRLYRLPLYFVESFRNVSMRTHVLLKLFIKFAMIWLLLSHSLSCVWYGITVSFENSQKDLSQEWFLSFDQSKPFEHYLIIFYFVQVTFLDIGFGDIVPKTDYERVYVIVVCSLGFIMLCGYLIAALSSALVEKARRLTSLRLRLLLIKSEMEMRTAPDTLIKKIMKFYDSLWLTRKGIGSVNELLDTLPEALAHSVYYDIFDPALSASLLFGSCDFDFKRALAKFMEICLYMAGDVILSRSEINSQMFYISKGTIQIMSYQDDETQVMTFGAGSVFGQIALLLSLPAKSEIHAATFCEIHALTRRNLFRVLGDYPKAKKIVLNAHRNLLLNVLADKFESESEGNRIKPENILTVNSFYKVPIEAAKLARDDICTVTTFPYVFMPDTIFIKVWNVLVSIIIVVICFYYPYCAAFNRRYPQNAEPLIVITDMILIFNIYLGFSTAYLRENILYSYLRDIAVLKFLRLSTYIDITAVLPIHYFIDDDSRVKPVFLCLRCLEFYKIFIFFNSAEQTVHMSMISGLRLVKYVLYFLFGGYVMGLIYYSDACYYEICNESSWFSESLKSGTVDSPFWVSIYFTISIMSGTGFGDVKAGNITDVIFIIFFGIIGVLLFIYLISEYSANLSFSIEPRQNFMELADRVNMFLLSHKMLSSERIRVRQFLNLQWEKNRGYEFTASHGLFYDTPQHLLTQANQYTKSTALQNMVLFKGMTNEVCRAMLKAAFRKVFPPHEVVIYAGDVCKALLIIEEGYCEITSGKDISIKRVVGAGKDMCTVELLLGLTSACHVRTLTHCTILKIEKSLFARALTLNPIAAKELWDYVSEFKNTPIFRKLQTTHPVRLHLTVHPPIQKSVSRFRYYRRQGGNKELRDPYLKLGLCQWMRHFLRSTTILPYGKLLKHWEISRCIFSFLSAIIFPLLPYMQLQFPVLFYFAFFLDITAWTDLYFRLHVCYYDKRNLLISHPLYTCGHYIKGSFFLDFIFSFPFDRIMYRPVYNSEGKTSVSDGSIDLLRLLRVGQIYRIPATFYNMGVDHLSSPNLFWILVMMSAFTLIFLNFLTSILVLFCVNYRKNKNGSYEVQFDPTYEKHFRNVLTIFHFSTEPYYVFIVQMYWTSVTAFSLGFGDISASTKELKMYVILVIIFSYLYFNYVTIKIASHLSSLNMNLTIFQKRMNHLIKYLKEENVEPLLRKHIVNHFEYNWKKTKGMQAQSVFVNFNWALKDDVMLHLYESTLKGVAAFSHVEPSFYRILSSHLDELNFQSGAAIYKHGDILSDLFIIHQGEVTLVGKNEDETDVLSVSMVFGHLDNLPRGIVQVSAVATKNVTLLKIRTIALYQLLAQIHGVQDVSEKLKSKEIMLKSKKDEAEETGNTFISSKNKGWLVRTTHTFSKHILILYVILSLYSANLASYILAFSHLGAYSLLTALSGITEVFFVFKIFLGFTTGYIDDTGEFVSEFRRIRQRYMRLTGFYLDFITTLPWGYLALLSPYKYRGELAGWLNMIRLFRLYHVWYFFNLKFDTLNVNMVMLTIVAIAVWTATLLHQCSCLWYLISCPMSDCPHSVTWNDPKFKNKYLTCLYFAVILMTTTGFGDLKAHSHMEILFVMILLFVGFFYTAIFIGQMVSTAQKSLFAKTNYEFQIESLKTYMTVNEVSHETQKSVLSYVANLWRNEKGQQIPELLESAPAYLIGEIKLSTYGHHINENPVLKSCSPLFRKELIRQLRRTVFFSGDVIVYQGEIKRTAYFVHAGLVESQNFQKHLPSQIYKKNTYFGLGQGVRRGEPYLSTFYAKTFCIILSLELRKWSFLSEFFPDDVQYILNKTKSEIK